MKSICIRTLILVVALSSALPAMASELVFICHKDLNYSKDTVKKAFTAWLDEPKMVDNKLLKPKLLEFLRVSAPKYEKLWKKNYFRRAINTPQLRDNDEQVVEFVATHETGLGYVSSKPNHPNVQVCGLE